MPISAIVLIVLRLYSIQWLLEGLVMLTTGAFELQNDNRVPLGLRVGPGIAMLLGSIATWFAAPSLARLIAGKHATTLQVPAPPLKDLYAFAFVFLGLYFVLRSLGDTIYWFHNAMVVAATMGDFNPERQQSGYQLVRSLIALAGGLVCIIFGKTWGGKLSERTPGS